MNKLVVKGMVLSVILYITYMWGYVMGMMDTDRP